MDKLFGIPMGPLATVLALLLAAVLSVVGALALRNRVFFRLGVRNLPRRPARTALIVLGLMLGTTIIAAALTSGDTMSATIRSSAITSLGSTDELVSVRGANVDVTMPLGVATAIVEPVAVQDVTTRQNEPRVTLFASDGPALRAFSEIRGTSNRVVWLDDLGPGEVYLNADAADELSAKPGDKITVFAGERSLDARVRDVVRFDGTGTDGSALLVGLPAAQSFLGRPDEVKHVLISNLGGPTSGVRYTDEITRLLQPTLKTFALEIDPAKRDALDAADAQGNAFMMLFTTFGSFSIAAGILLIFLIFVMLAAERRGELGIARAIGTQRRHLIEMYLFEGIAYDLLAAAVGAALGVLVAFGMVFVLASALGSQGIEIRHDVQLRSVVVAYALGVLLTFVVVTASAWRVSRLNIVSAVRNLPEPPAYKRRKRRWIGGLALMALGVLFVASGISGGTALPFILGVAAAIVGAVPVLQALGLPERVAFTFAGLGLVVFLLLPFDTYEALAGTTLKMDFSVWIASGLLLVIGAAWVIVYNADLLLGVLMAVAGRVRALTPVLRMSMAYPLRSRFRTGITLAMFTLVVFTLVVGAVTSGTFVRAFDNVDTFSGGFDVRAGVAAVSPIENPAQAVALAPGLRAQDFRVVAAESYIPGESRQLGRYASRFEDYPVRGVDDAFLRRTTYGFAATARGYSDPWRAMAEQPGLAIVDALIAPRRDNWMTGNVPPD